MDGFDCSIDISVVMLTHNRDAYLSESIESVLKQTYTDFEFIIVDNGSTDETIGIIERYKKQDSRIISLYLDRNYGISTGRNRGLKLSSGQYIAFVDDDDIVYPDMLEYLYKLASENNSDISFCGSNNLVNGIEVPNHVFSEKVLLSPEMGVIELLKRNMTGAAMPAKLIRRTLIENTPFVELGKYDDIRVCYKYFANSNHIAAHGLPKYVFRKHSDNNSGFTIDHSLIRPEQLDEYFEVYAERTTYLSKMFPDIKDYVKYTEISFLISMYDKVHKHKITGCENQLDYMKSIILYNMLFFLESKYLQDFEKEWVELYFK